MTEGNGRAMKQISRYPILDHLTALDREAVIDQAERGEPLTAEQCKRLGLSEALADVILLPTSGALTLEQLRAAFPEPETALRDLVNLCQPKEETNGAILYPVPQQHS